MLNLGWISLPLLTPTLLASVQALQRLSAHTATQSRTITLPESPVIRLLSCTFRSSAQNIPPRASCMDAHTSHLDTSNSHAVRASIVSTLICEDTFRTTSLPMILLNDCSSLRQARRSAELCWWAIEERIRAVLVETPRGEYPELNTPRQHPESRRHAIAIDNVFSRPIKLSSANSSRDSLRGGRDGRSRSRESKCQDDAIRTERCGVILTTRRSERVRFRGTALPQSAIAPCCPSTNNPPCR